MYVHVQNLEIVIAGDGCIVSDSEWRAGIMVLLTVGDLFRSVLYLQLRHFLHLVCLRIRRCISVQICGKVGELKWKCKKTI